MAVIFPISLLFGVKSDLGPLSKVDKELDNIGMRMRLTGRDLMRLGGSMDRFFSAILSQIGGILKGSLLWESGLKDVSWALEDVGSVLGDTLAPILDIATRLIESFASALEVSPILQWIVVIGILGVVIGKVMSMLLSWTGAINLFFGTLITAHRGSLNFLQSIKALGIAFSEGKPASDAYIKSIAGLGKTTKKSGKVAASGFMDWIKSMGGAKGILKSLTIGALALGGAAIISALAFAAFQNLSDPLMELFTSIGDAIAPITDFFGGIIEGISEAIDACPALAAAFVAAVVAIGVGLIILQKVLGKVASTVVDKLSGGLDKVASPMKKVSEGAWKNTLANAALVASIALLVFALGSFFATLASTGVGVWEAVAALGAVLAVIVAFIVGLAFCAKMLSEIGPDIWIGIAAVAALVGIVILLTWALTMLLVPLTQLPGGIANLYLLSGALILLMGSFAAIAIVLGTFAPVAAVGAAIMLVLAAAALILGAAVLLAGIGIDLAAKAIFLLVGNLSGVLTLVPAIFGLAAGFTALGLAGLLAGPGLILLAAGLMATALALAFLNSIGLGNVAAAAGAALVTTFVPRLQEGGLVTAGGLAYLEPAEVVTPAGEAGGTYHNTFYISATIKSEDDIKALAKEINRLQASEIGRTH